MRVSRWTRRSTFISPAAQIPARSTMSAISAYSRPRSRPTPPKSRVITCSLAAASATGAGSGAKYCAISPRMKHPTQSSGSCAPISSGALRPKKAFRASRSATVRKLCATSPGRSFRRPPEMQQLVFLPDSAPFTESQRAWLNGFVAGLLGMERAQGAPGPPVAAPQIDEDFPWHDPTLALDERIKLAHGRSFERQLMAAMGQLDCGQCGYLCKTYAEAIAGGAEADLGKCVPGGRITAKKIKELLARRPSAAATPAAPIAAPPPVERGYGRAAPVTA